MAYRHKFGITHIKPFDRHGRDQLDISFEADDCISDQRGEIGWNPRKCKPVLLHVLKDGEFEHNHITLTHGQAKKLHQWLTDYLADPDQR